MPEETEQQKETQQAEATEVEEPAAEEKPPEQMVPVATVARLRAKNRELREQLSGMGDRITSLEEKIREPSPVEKFAEENPEEPVPARIMAEDQQFHREQAAKRSNARDKPAEPDPARQQKGESEIAAARLRYASQAPDGLDFDTVTIRAARLLTPDEQQSIQDAADPDSGEDAAEVAYRLCLKHLQHTGTPKTPAQEPKEGSKPKETSNENEGGPEPESGGDFKDITDFIFEDLEETPT